MTPADTGPVAAFLEGSYRSVYSPLFSATAWEAFPPEVALRDWPAVLRCVPGATSVVAEDATRIVGFARSRPARNGEAGTVPSVRSRELQLLYVSESHFGSGLARRLVDEVLAPGEPAELWVVEGNRRAQAFYAKLGFVADGAHFDLGQAESVAAGIKEIRMVR